MSDNLARKYGQILEQMPEADRQAMGELKLFQRAPALPATAEEQSKALWAEMKAMGVESGREVAGRELGKMAGPETPGHAGRDLMARYEAMEPPAEGIAAKYGRAPAQEKEQERGRGRELEPGG